MEKHNVLILGSGGREHALAWKISQSDLLGKLYIAPGNAGTSSIGENINVQVNDFHGIHQIVIEKSVDLLVVGPEEPLVKGIRDYLSSAPDLQKLMIIGPGKSGAALEGSKDFAKEFMQRNGIPTAAYATFTRAGYEAGVQFLQSLKPPYVLKADGLAAGKGVIITGRLDEAIKVLYTMLHEEQFGEASSKVVIEEFLDGIELSVFILTDGQNYILLPEAKDYKRAGEGDSGPNTGGMGSVSPVPFADTVFMRKVEERIVQPTVSALRKENIPYNGFIFFGLMNVSGNPYVIEYNARLGDPETEVVLPRIKSDLLKMMIASCNGTLQGVVPEFDNQTAACVMLVSGGYPGDYQKGKEITIDQIDSGSMFFHAGTRIDTESGKTVTSGGRVIAVTSLDYTLTDALKQSYQAIRRVQFEGMYYRSDIGMDLTNK